MKMNKKISSSKKKKRILVVDDVQTTLEVLQRNLVSKGYQVFTALNVAEAIRILEARSVDLVITDLRMPKVSGLELIRHIRENCKDTEVIMITGYGTIEGAVDAIKMGAEEYLTKPFTDEELFSAVQRAFGKLRLRKAKQKQSYQKTVTLPGLISESEVMLEVFEVIEKAAPSLATILITGESGTGKELVARGIHYSSPRASARFVAVNCGAIPEELLESELFGHVKGAFTGAIESRAGFFQTADGGTLFLDEISNMSSSMQVKLLRVLQDKHICMVGATRTQKVDVRIIVATNKDLSSLVRKGTFREDLFFRLNVITINIPPLRERGDDILLLTHYFAAKFARELGKQTPEISDTTLQALKNYQWPGNVRELENVIQHLVVMTDGSLIEIPDLPSFMRFSALKETGFNRTLAEVEAEYIRNVLASVNGNKTQAAKILGIDRKTLRKKIAFGDN